VSCVKVAKLIKIPDVDSGRPREPSVRQGLDTQMEWGNLEVILGHAQICP